MRSRVKLKCAKCGGQKFIGEQYRAFGTYYVDLTCVVCSDTKDVPVDKLNALLAELEKKARKSPRIEYVKPKPRRQ